LKRLTAALGPVRELDVALACCWPDRAEGAGAAVEALRAPPRRGGVRRFEHLREACDPGRPARCCVRSQIRSSTRRGVAARATAACDAERRRLARASIDRAPRSRLGCRAGAILIVERVHAVRIATKRLRYALELAGELRLARTASLVSSSARDAGDAGQLHDLDVLRAASRATPRRAADSSWPEDLERLRTTRRDIRQLHARLPAWRAALAALTDRVARPDCPMPGPFHLYLVRHAVAEERGSDWPDDSQRPLSDDGVKRWRREARGLVALERPAGPDPDQPVHAGAADGRLLAAAFPKKPKVVEWPALEPRAKPREVLRALEPKGASPAWRWSPRARPGRTGGPAGGVQDAAGIQEGRRRADPTSPSCRRRPGRGGSTRG
jgi:CHAD domain-containing protein